MLGVVNFVDKLSKEKFGHSGCTNFFLYFCCVVFRCANQMIYRAHIDFRQRRSRAMTPVQGEGSCPLSEGCVRIRKQELQAYCADR